jgi:hypothetical protein
LRRLALRTIGLRRLALRLDISFCNDCYTPVAREDHDGYLKITLRKLLMLDDVRTHVVREKYDDFLKDTVINL